ncbi:MAG TPA: TonB-dependent receptor [Pyrinomonadaceae bacterium]|nr:TonB-dependent receptor [Pyrinomonadaceae bacterium]
MKRIFVALFLTCSQAFVICSHVAPATAQTSPGVRVSGVVLDQTKAPVAHAQVSLRSTSTVVAQTFTGGDGRFVFESVNVAAGTLVVRAEGFAPAQERWSASKNGDAQIEIVLAPSPLAEQLTVTATRTETRVGETAASVVTLTPEELRVSAAVTLDDALRQVPDFQLFRRSGSLTANPTSQGVSLRGTGASGASRAVVLADGVPLNDPFGGWVYWGRVPRAAINRVEVLEGGASSLYGSDALGGVVSVITRRPEAPTLSLELSAGSQHTSDAALFAGAQRGKWGASLSGELLSTDGYVPVDERERGRVDTLAGSRHSALDFRLERKFRDGLTAFASASYYGEARTNGTPLQTNRTHLREFAAGGDWQSALFGSFSARAYGGAQTYDQNFSSIAADRNSETLTRVQRVPSQFVGLSVQWSRALGARQTLVAGFEGREVRGVSNELAYTSGRPTAYLSAGGRERSAGLFVEDLVRVTSRLLVTGGVRFDRWRNYDALSSSRPVTRGASSLILFPDRTESAVSPQLSALYQINTHVSLAASGYRSFRAPTLNELYRSFRVGNVLTLADDNLRAEHLTGGEAGVNVKGFGSRLNARTTFFWAEITSPVANVTLSTTPALITRQRQNLGRTRSRGIEAVAEARVARDLSVSGGLFLSGAVVTRFPTNAALEGLRVPQVARDQFTFQARYSNAKTLTAALQGRFTGVQFDDDQNLFPLDRAFTLDAFASRRLARQLELFVAAENLFDQRYEIGRTPVVTLGQPRRARAGLRLNLGAR